MTSSRISQNRQTLTHRSQDGERKSASRGHRRSHVYEGIIKVHILQRQKGTGERSRRLATRQKSGELSGVFDMEGVVREKRRYWRKEIVARIVDITNSNWCTLGRDCLSCRPKEDDRPPSHARKRNFLAEESTNAIANMAYLRYGHLTWKKRSPFFKESSALPRCTKNISRRNLRRTMKGIPKLRQKIPVRNPSCSLAGAAASYQHGG